MLKPTRIQESGPIELNLGIKLSLANLKMALALLYVFWKASGEILELVYANQQGHTVILKDELQQEINFYFQDVLTENAVTPASLENIIKHNPLLTSQIEALKVALEQVWKIAIVTFVDGRRAFTAEREGGNRYSKNLSFTKNVDIIDLVIQPNNDEYKKILFNWITNKSISINRQFENELIKAFSLISMEDIYKVRIIDGNDIRFVNTGIYEKIVDTPELHNQFHLTRFP